MVDESSDTAKVLASTNEIGFKLLSNLEALASMVSRSQKVVSGESLIQDPFKPLSEDLNDAISTPASSKAVSEDEHSRNPRFRGTFEVASWPRITRYPKFVLLFIFTII